MTDRHATAGRHLVDVIEACVDAGLRAVQLREKDLDAAEFFDFARELRAVTSRHGARFLVNGRVDVALAVGADGVHLPSASPASPEAVRHVIGPQRFLGVSTHAASEAEAAARAGADFVVFGPVYETPSKRPYGAPQGIEALAEACRRAPIPVLAIGGVTPSSVCEVRAAGASGVAVIRALLAASDPAAATKELLAAWAEAGA